MMPSSSHVELIDRVVILNDDSAESGGASAVMRTSVEVLRRLGVPVTLINGHAHVDEHLAQTGAEILSLGGRNLLESRPRSAAWLGLYNRRMYEAVRVWIATHDTPRTVYHLHNWHKVLTPAVLAALRPVRDRLFFSLHDYFIACPNGAFFNYRTSKTCPLTPMSLACLCTNCDRRSYAQKIWRALRHAILTFAFDLKTSGPTFLMPHPGMMSFIKRSGLHTEQAIVLQNPVSGWHRKRVTAEANSSVFFIGRLATDKGVDALAEAGRCAGLQLTIVGDGPLRESLAKAYPEHRFLGWQTHAAITQLTAKARLVVVPTRWPETFGLVAFEALLSGIPVIVSKQALIAEEVVSKGIGLSCDPEDVSGLAGLLRHLVDDDDLIARLSKSAFSAGNGIAIDSEVWTRQLFGHYMSQLAKSASAPAVASKRLATHAA